MRELFNIAKSGLMASERQTAVTANNIANANTPGFSRQRVDTSPIDYKKNNLSIGLGVNVDQVTRLRNEMIDSQIRMKESMIEEFGARSEVLEQIQEIFSTQTGNDLDQVLGKFLNSFSELSSNPEDYNRRQNVIRETQNLTQKFQSMSQQLGSIQEQTAEKASGVVSEINGLLSELADLNHSIRRGNAAGKPDNNSLDVQTQKLEQLAKLVDIDTLKDENGGLEVRIGGIVVIQGDKAVNLRGESDAANQQFRVRLENGTIIKPEGGKLGANIALISDEIPGYQSELDAIANALITEVNSLHTSGFDLNGDAGLNFFDPDATGARNITFNMAVGSDPNKIAASAAPNAPGNTQIADQIFGLRNQKLSDGQTVIEKSITLGSKAGSELNNARIQMDTARSAKNMLFNQQEKISGVNIDEELTDLIKFQNSYQASARVLNSAQQMYDTLLSIV